MDSIILELNSNRRLEIILTEVELSHRFIHFTINEGTRNFKKRLDDYISVIRELEGQNFKHFRITQDTEVYDAKGQMTLPGNPRGYTVMLVCDLPEGAGNNEISTVQKSKISIGEVMMLDANMLKI